PSTVTAVRLTDAVPAALLGAAFGPPSQGSYDPATGVLSGLNLGTGQSVTLTLTGTIDASATGSPANPARGDPPPGRTDPHTANNTASAPDRLTPQAALAITKTDGAASAVPGGSTTYTVVVSNKGPSAVTGARVSGPLPAGATGGSWTATASSGGGSVSGPS